jgi:hypothetical protein
MAVLSNILINTQVTESGWRRPAVYVDLTSGRSHRALKLGN